MSIEPFPVQNPFQTAVLLFKNCFVSLLFGLQKPFAIGALASSRDIQAQAADGRTKAGPCASGCICPGLPLTEHLSLTFAFQSHLP